LDGVVVLALLFFLCWLRGVYFQREFLVLGLVTFLLMMVIFQGAQLYRPWRGANLMGLVRQVFVVWTLVAAILVTLGYVTKTSAIFSRQVVLSWMVLAPLVLVGLRLKVYMGLHWARERGFNSRTVVIAGAGELGKQLAKNVVDTPWLGMQLYGFFDDNLVGEKIELQPGGRGYPVLGDLDDMVQFARDHKIDMVYLALPLRAEDRFRQVVDALKDTTASVYFAPDLFAFSLLHASLTDLRGIPLVSLWETPFYGINGWLKRVEDLVLASIILLAVFPLMLVIALGVKLTSPGPVIFKQRRYGLDGEEIVVYKFRTMTVCQDGPEVPQATRQDHRVTRFGAFLRRHSLDELPQFFNVLKGTMSIVGPRPHAVAHNEYYRRRIPAYMLRHKVRPGLTGWAQINGWRGETETLEKMEKRIEYDLDYLRRWSLWFDLKIIFLTMFRGFRDTHAY
jgi:putative colanic acid biosynthesis UDP-glucose lipid carrier transferase